MTERIALFANHDSAQLAEIAVAVRDAGGDPVMFDIRLGGDTLPAMTLDGDRAVWGGVDFADIRAMHIRCTAPRTLPTLPPLLNDATAAEYRLQFIREQAFNAATYAFFEHQALRGKLVINPLTSAYVDHNSKGQLYEKLRAAGFTAPRSLSTNDPAAARRFLDEVGEAVMKPAIGVGSTRLVTDADRESRLDELALCPTLFQQRIVGPTIRIHVVGGRMLLALEIESEGIDSRTGTKSFHPIDLPESEARAVAEATTFLGLHYAAWDGILDADGKLSLLDCNPGPFVMWLPDHNRRMVFDALARYLITFSRTGSLEAARAAV